MTISRPKSKRTTKPEHDPKALPWNRIEPKKELTTNQRLVQTMLNDWIEEDQSTGLVLPVSSLKSLALRILHLLESK